MATISLYKIQVPPTIVPGAQITLCGEAPGKDEVWQKKGFVGSSGKMLQRICRAADIDFDKCNLTNIAKRQPTGNDFAVFYRDKKRLVPTEELLYWRQLAVAEVTRYKPNILVALGNEPLRTFCTYADGITKWNGSLLESDVIPGLKIMPGFHPAYIMRDNWHEYYISIRHFRKVAIEAKASTRILKEPTDEFVIKPTLEQVLGFITYIESSGTPWYLDVETVGDSLRCFGLSCEAKEQFALCVPIHTSTGPYWPVVEEAQIWVALSRCANSNTLFRNQNAMYDIDYLLDMGVEPSLDFDPMIGMNCLFPEFRRGLDFTTALYTYYPYYKDEGKTWGKRVPDEKVWTYNCKDQVSTPKVSKAIIKDLEEKGLTKLTYERSTKMFGVAVEMQRNRLLLDPVWFGQLQSLLSTAREEVHSELTQLLGRDINVKSSKEVQELLFTELRLPAKYKRGTGAITVDENALKELRAASPDIKPLNLILKERHLRTKLSNYINIKFDHDANGDVYLPYQPFIGGTKTSRWSFTTSPKWRGSSPQTIPKVIRLMYKPPHDSVFWQRDLSQAEARIVAWLANCQFLLDVFASPIKIHKVVGARLFNKTPDEIITDSMEYDISKRVVHAYDYMMRYKKLAVTACLPLAFAKQTLETYGLQVPEIDQWHNSIRETVIRTGQLVTPIGRVRECFKACSAIAHTGGLPEEILRDLVSYIPQSVVPDLTNECMWKLWDSCAWIRWHQQGHDSWLASGKHERTHELYELSEKAADIHIKVGHFPDCVIPGEFQWGYRWGAMLKYKVGEPTTYDAWLERATHEGYFALNGKNGIKEKLVSLLEEAGN